MKKYFKLGMCLKIAKTNLFRVNVDNDDADDDDDDDDYYYILFNYYSLIIYCGKAGMISLSTL